ncbi:hypothetical protein SBY92_000147 [Candida maltosa Xu316]
MAKSLRSKSKLNAKKGEFSKYVDERNKRIAAKLAIETKKQDEAKKANEDNKEGEEGEEDKKDSSMDLDKDKKVSTSGWRDSRSQVYKQRQLKNKRKKTLKF